MVACHELVELGRDFGKRGAFERFLLMLEQRFRGAIDQEDAVTSIDGDHAGGDAGENGFGERPAGIELGIGGPERSGLLFEPARHPVEGAGEGLDLVLGLLHRHPNGEIALLDAPDSRHQMPNGPNNPVGHVERGQDGKRDDDK